MVLATITVPLGDTTFSIQELLTDLQKLQGEQRGESDSHSY